MTSTLPQSLAWHVDGHVIHLELNHEEIVITGTMCPFGEEGAGHECWHPRVGCIVRWFLNRFSLDCHVGVCAPEASLEIAWSLAGDGVDLDLSQVYVISLSDPLFASWVADQALPAGE